jgi:hypothetical protein
MTLGSELLVLAGVLVPFAVVALVVLRIVRRNTVNDQANSDDRSN